MCDLWSNSLRKCGVVYGNLCWPTDCKNHWNGLSFVYAFWSHISWHTSGNGFWNTVSLLECTVPCALSSAVDFLITFQPLYFTTGHHFLWLDKLWSITGHILLLLGRAWVSKPRTSVTALQDACVCLCVAMYWKFKLGIWRCTRTFQIWAHAKARGGWCQQEMIQYDTEYLHGISIRYNMIPNYTSSSFPLLKENLKSVHSECQNTIDNTTVTLGSCLKRLSCPHSN